MRNVSWSAVPANCLGLLTVLMIGNTHALDCGTFNFPICSKALTDPAQFAGGFDPQVPFGGFGGGEGCKASISHTPVILVHGNGDSAIGWDSPAPARAGKPQRPSVYGELKAHGYNDCEVFGVTYLEPAAQEYSQTANNFHRPEKYEVIWKFIQAVKAYTGSAKVDIVGHSLGSSMTLATLDYYTDDKKEQAWLSVHRFINIAGGLHGLNTCLWPAAYLSAPTCQAEHGGNGDQYYEFGFLPDLPPILSNRWTAVNGDHSLRQAPKRHSDVAFYTISAGQQDDIHCPLIPVPTVVDCARGPLFIAASNVRTQIDIGSPPPSMPPSWTQAVDQNYQNLVPRDLGGIGHFGARNYAGPIIVQMLTTDCRGAACKGAYVGTSRLSKP